MRVFRLKKRRVNRTYNDVMVETNDVTNHRDYIGIENLLKYGKETYERYRGEQYDGSNVAEIYEKIDNKWVKLSESEIKELLNLT